MSQHRLHTFDIPAATDPRRRVRLFHPDKHDTGRAMQLVIAAFFAALLVVWVLGEYRYARDPLARPVSSGAVQVYEQPALAVEEARIEGFRAGMATCADQGATPRLSAPVGAR